MIWISAHPLPERASIGIGVVYRGEERNSHRCLSWRGEGVIMRNAWKCVLGLVVGLGVFVGSAGAQFKNGSQPTELNIPRVSQRGTVSQRIGLTDITIAYHRPEVGGREIWGKTVPLGKVWRAGANENTTITFLTMFPSKGSPLRRGLTGCTPFPIKISGR